MYTTHTHTHTLIVIYHRDYLNQGLLQLFKTAKKLCYLKPVTSLVHFRNQIGKKFTILESKKR